MLSLSSTRTLARTPKKHPAYSPLTVAMVPTTFRASYLTLVPRGYLLLARRKLPHFNVSNHPLLLMSPPRDATESDLETAQNMRQIEM